MSAARLRKRKLGRAAVEISELGLGTAPLGELFERVDDNEAARLIEAAQAGKADPRRRADAGVTPGDPRSITLMKTF